MQSSPATSAVAFGQPGCSHNRLLLALWDFPPRKYISKLRGWELFLYSCGEIQVESTVLKLIAEHPEGCSQSLSSINTSL